MQNSNPSTRYIDYKLMPPEKQRRKHARMKVLLSGQFKTKGAEKSQDCFIVDIGTGGMKIQSGIMLYEGEEVEVNFRLKEISLSIQGPIIRSEGKYSVIRYPESSSKSFIDHITNFIHKSLFSSDSQKTMV